MKKGLSATVIGLIAFCVMVATAVAAARMMSVTVREGVMRATPMPFGPIVATFAHGDRVAVEGESGGWLKVRQLEGKQSRGWMHVSALTSRRVVLRSGEGEVAAAASDEELALAGKGFNRQVEASFKTRNSQLDYGAVDRMEKIDIRLARMEQFLREGGLTVQGGAVDGK
ncbi:MAG: SH3 domain-containing protein [Desulfobulbaceae bacterium]|nr:SH3 domain-containing protein [Desulfobulbaceae bacterium]